MSKKIVLSLVLAFVLAFASLSSLACTAIYVGSDLTADGTYMFARSEDYSSSYNKMYFFAPAGKHTAGELYYGCYGFSYTFTHDSYSYTAFQDDNLAGVEYECPDCGSTHEHTPYQAAGTNNMGLSMSATETLGGTAEIRTVDPMEDEGIEEAEIPTVILSECATAREGIELLCKIYDEAGATGGSGIVIADHSEAWYIENVSGHQYIAVKLTPSMIFSEPNMSIIGLIDLDDTENVIASAGLIDTAIAAGTFVGDKEANTINYAESYTAGNINGRMVQALEFFGMDLEEVKHEDYMISNVDAEGNIVPMYTNIKLNRVFTIADVVDYYHLSTIGGGSNTETHIFQISSEDSIIDTMEWVAVNDASKNVFVPYYPMLTTDTDASYQVSTVPAVKTQEQPESGAYYATSFNVRTPEGRVKVDGYCVLPENWADSYYWTVDVLSHVANEEQSVVVDAALAALQAECYDLAAELTAAAAGENAAVACTEISNAMAAKVHAAMVELAKDIVK